jgi:hypothetical protein
MVLATVREKWICGINPSGNKIPENNYFLPVYPQRKLGTPADLC